MKTKISYTSDELSDIIDATCSPSDAEIVKDALYIGLCKSVVSAFYELYDSADAFIRSCFYLCDLMDNNVLTPEQIKEIDDFIHTKALTYDRKGEKDNGGK